MATARNHHRSVPSTNPVCSFCIGFSPLESLISILIHKTFINKTFMCVLHLLNFLIRLGWFQIGNTLSSQGLYIGGTDVMRELRRVRNAADTGLSAYELHTSWLADGRMNTLHLDLTNIRVAAPLLGVPPHNFINKALEDALANSAPYNSNVFLCAEDGADSTRAHEHKRIYEQFAARSV
jgi:hypothetical protein